QGALSGVDEACCLVPVGHVALDDDCRGPCRYKLRSKLVSCCSLPKMMDRHRSTRGSQATADLDTETAGRTRHQNPAAGQVTDIGRSGHRAYQAGREPRNIWTVFRSVNSSIPSRPNSAPKPLSRRPPSGSSGYASVDPLTHTVPRSRPSVSSNASSTSRVQIDAA